MEETEGHGRGRLLNFCCSIFRDRKRSLKRKPFQGGVAQLGEHLPCKQGVMGSIPIISTKITTRMQSIRDVILLSRWVKRNRDPLS